MLRTIVGLFAGIAVLGAASTAEATVFKIGTVAPPGSAWATQFEAMAKEVSKATGGDVELQFVYSQSDEPSLVGKVQGGAELQGGAVTAAGLAKIYPDVLAFQMPGLWGEDTNAGWRKLESARSALRGQIDAAFNNAGVTILGWGDVGVARMMGSKPVVKPGDLNGLSSFVLNGDTVAPIFAPGLGLKVGTPLSIGEVAFKVKSFDVFTAPPLAAVSLGWHTNITHINTMPVAYLIGALVVNTKAFESISSDESKKKLKEGGEKAGKNLTGRIRSADNKAFGILKTRCGTEGTHDPSDSEKAEWRAKFAEIRNQLKTSNVISSDFFNKIVNLAK